MSVREHHAVLFIKRPGVYKTDPRRRGLFFLSVSNMEIYFWIKETTWDKMLQMIDYIATVNAGCEDPGWTNVVTNIS